MRKQKPDSMSASVQIGALGSLPVLSVTSGMSANLPPSPFHFDLGSILFVYTPFGYLLLLAAPALIVCRLWRSRVSAEGEEA